MNTAIDITNRITMYDVFAYYRFTPNRAGFICCPFHNEKTPSLKVYADGKRFKCFGCGIGGSVIDFVMRLFNLTFRQAILKIDYDFNLNLVNNKPLTIAEKRKIEQREQERLKNKRDKEILKQAEKYYFSILCNIEKLIRSLKIKSSADITDMYAELLKKREYYQYIYEHLENKLKQFEKTD